MIPKGLKLLRGSKKSEGYTVKQLNDCCTAHPQGCGHKRECNRLFDVRCGEWPLQATREPKPLRKKVDSGDWMPTLHIRKVVATLREGSC